MKLTADNKASGRRNGAPSEDNGTRERILREARTLFRERGYEGTVMSQTARNAGVTTAALYWHFTSKADLCAEVLGQDFRAFYAELLERAVGDTPEQKLRAFAQTFVELQLQETELDTNFSYVQLRAVLSEEAQAEIRRLERQILDLLRGILHEGQESGAFAITDVTVTAFALTTMLEYVFVWFNPDGRSSRDEVAALHAELAAKVVRAE